MPSPFRAVAALAVMLATAAATTPAPLPPSTKWRMDYAETECRLLRSFGEGKDQVTVQFSQIVPTPHLDVALVAAGIRATDAPAAAAFSTTTIPAVRAVGQGFAAEGRLLPNLRFDPNAGLREAIAGDVARGEPTLFRVDARGFRVALDLGPMGPALKSLDTCMDDLVRTWGLDPAEQRARRTGPVPVSDPASWFRAEDFPLEQRRAAAGALVIVRLGVAADGSVASCAVAKAGGDKAFEDLTCRVATGRARFTPATGASGEPIASYWAQRIRWQPGAPFLVRGS